MANETTEMWKQYRAEIQGRKAERRENRINQIIKFCEKHSISYKFLSGYQIRLNNELDIFPTYPKYHNIVTGKRGTIRNLDKFLNNLIKVE